MDRHELSRPALLAHPMRGWIAGCITGGAMLAAAWPSAGLAHGFVGQRFFPATIATDDPFVADELSLPTVSSVRMNGTDDSPASRQTTVSGEFSKRITDDFGLSLGLARQRTSFGRTQPAITGNQNAELGLKSVLHKDPAAETLVSAGLTWEIGGSGTRSVAERSSTYTPSVFFGKGFGNLPAGYEMLRPLAVTGSVGVAIPGHASTTTTSVDQDTGVVASQVDRNPHVLQAGLSLQYSLPYLQSFVKDTGLVAPWSRMIPIVEIAAAKPLDRIQDRGWTGTVNPGVLWVGRAMQLGVEAVVPMNHASGRGLGVQAQVHFFLDDLFPTTLGRPLFGGNR